MSNIHTVETIEGWGVDYVRKFLNYNKKDFSLNDDEICRLEELGINGRAFLRYTEEKLIEDGLRKEPASNLVDYIIQVKSQKQPIISTDTTIGSSKSPNNSVSIYIDNSNFFIEGLKIVSYLKKVNVYDHKKPEFLNFYVDYGLLITIVLKGRKLNKIFVVSSISPNDTVWDRMKFHGCKIQTYPQNALNKEKKVDTKLVCKLMVFLFTENPGTLLLVAGDSDYCPLIEEAKKLNWKTETWFWSGLSGVEDYLFTTPIAYELRKLSLYEPLEKYYQLFTYVTGPDFTNRKHSLEISGNIIKDWKHKNETLMECFCSLKLFGRWNWVNETTAHLYFENKKQLESAQSLFEHKYPYLWFTVIKKIVRRNSFKIQREKWY
ncbi:hypothetical protein C1645_828420 [Glomus cerebriforme]|uniref:NYN domain-containing protein n=1 Tax=Glomus cerebriforme TaxID=658196 RepID=A0A397SLG2_9GLOM|nr:hypothetical protein C1645_828420 [Glomus cerebriforme]